MTDTEASGRPADWIAAARTRWGGPAVARRAAVLLAGGVDRDLVPYLGGPGARSTLDRGPANAYWARVWGARAYLYVWDDTVTPDVVAALGDAHWRVREMAAKVIALRAIGAAGDPLAPLLSDPVPRVRVAVARALGVVGEAEHAPPLLDARDDREPSVRNAAERAVTALSIRLDRDLAE